MTEEKKMSTLRQDLIDLLTADMDGVRITQVVASPEDENGNCGIAIQIHAPHKLWADIQMGRKTNND